MFSVNLIYFLSYVKIKNNKATARSDYTRSTVPVLIRYKLSHVHSRVSYGDFFNLYLFVNVLGILSYKAFNQKSTVV